MGIYIYRYGINLTEQDIQVLTNTDMKSFIADAKDSFSVFNVRPNRSNLSAANMTYMIKADNYRDCYTLVRAMKESLESAAFTLGSLGSVFTGSCNDRFITGKNGIRLAMLQNEDNTYDVVMIYKVSKDTVMNFSFVDTVSFVESGYRFVHGYFNNKLYDRAKVII